jgi:hypothetical protein
MTSGFGSGPNLFGGSAPGFVDPFSQSVLAANTAASTQAMNNRYAQLGLSGNPQGGTPQQAAAGGYSLQPGGAPTTAQAMDVGTIPSLTGGIAGAANATMGQMQSNALQNPAGGGGKGSSSLGGLATLMGGV